MIELDPCPFCDGPAEIQRAGDEKMSTIYACLDCGCELETGETENHGHAWNNRPVKSVSRKDLDRSISSLKSSFAQRGRSFEALAMSVINTLGLKLDTSNVIKSKKAKKNA